MSRDRSNNPSDGEPDPRRSPEARRTPSGRRAEWSADAAPSEWGHILEEARRNVPLSAAVHQARETFHETMDEEFPAWRLGRRRALQAGMLVVLCCLAVGAGMYARGWLRQREADRQSQLKGRIIQLIDPLGSASPGPITFVWRPSPICTGYEVELCDSEYRLIWSNPLTSEAEVELPRESRILLQPGQTYYWRVRGFDRDSREVAGSELQELSVTQ